MYISKVSSKIQLFEKKLTRGKIKMTCFTKRMASSE